MLFRHLLTQSFSFRFDLYRNCLFYEFRNRINEYPENCCNKRYKSSIHKILSGVYYWKGNLIKISKYHHIPLCDYNKENHDETTDQLLMIKKLLYRWKHR